MVNRIYKLSFLTPVRFGLMSNTASQYSVHADTLFSALFLALLESGKESVFLDAVRESRLSFSDGMPYRGEDLYLPRPVGVYPAAVEAETDPGTRKLLKKIQWIPLNSFQAWLSGKVQLKDLVVRFGQTMERTRVNRREEIPKPYQVEGFRFDEDCGVYVIVRAASDEEISVMDEGMKLLAAAGIGGLKSSGWGKFVFEVFDAPECLRDYLEDNQSERQMLLCVAMPSEKEGKGTVADASYILVQRSGYTAPSREPTSLKQTVWLFAPGSVFKRRFAGDILDVSTSAPHPVWKYAKAMMMGVKTE